MSLLNKHPNLVTENDLMNLIHEKESEKKFIEYKMILVGKKQEDRKEFLYDISSFTNTQGGYLVLGMKEERGFPTELVGISSDNIDSEILRLENMLRDGIRPPISGIETAAVNLKNGNFAIVIRIPKSWNPPHQVTYQNSFRFYARASNGKYLIDVDELRTIFSLSASAAENIKLFRIDRISKIVSGDLPVPLESGGKIVVHLLPLSAFTNRQPIDMNQLWGNQHSLGAVLRGGAGVMPLLNIDGIILSSPQRPTPRYVQVFRNGCIEVTAGWTDEANKQKSLPCPAFESAIIEHIYRAKQLFECLGVLPPIVIMITMIEMKGWDIAARWHSSNSKFDRDPIFIPELLLENFDGVVKDEVRPLIDTIWNAAGSLQSPNYDNLGHYKNN